MNKLGKLVDAAYVFRVKRDIKNPSLETIMKLAKVLGVEVRFGDKML